MKQIPARFNDDEYKELLEIQSLVKEGTLNKTIMKVILDYRNDQKTIKLQEEEIRKLNAKIWKFERMISNFNECLHFFKKGD